MDILSVGSAMTSTGSAALVVAGTAAVMLRLDLPAQLPGATGGGYVKSCGRVLCRCLPEAIGLTTCLTLALLLRLWGDTTVLTDPEEIQIWSEIKRDWPILMGADTLLGLQAMLRMVMIISVANRMRTEGPGPLSGMAAVLTLGAAITRGALASKHSGYILDGPLGGDMTSACEVAVIPLLCTICVPALRSKKCAALTAMLTSAALWIASHNFLKLEGIPNVDQLFVLAHVFEIMAAFAFLCQTVCRYCGLTSFKSSHSMGYVSLLMPAQQTLAAYYFLTAFEPDRKLVAMGRPFCIIILGSLAQLAAYLVSVAFYLAEDSDEITVESTTPNESVHNDAGGPKITIDDSETTDLKAGGDLPWNFENVQILL